MNTRYQDAVPFYIEKGFAEYGVTASNAVVKSWTDKGGKVYAKSTPVPIKQVIGSTRLSTTDLERIREILVTLSQSDAGLKVLAATGYKGFVAPNPDVERHVMAWLRHGVSPRSGSRRACAARQRRACAPLNGARAIRYAPSRASAC